MVAMPEDVGAFDSLQQRQNPLGGGDSRRILFVHPYEDIISVENLLAAWKEFVAGKRKKRDVQEFQHLSRNAVLAFWLAYIFTRPLGASFADWFGKSPTIGGLGRGDGTVSLVLAVLLMGFVWYLWATKLDVEDTNTPFMG